MVCCYNISLVTTNNCFSNIFTKYRTKPRSPRKSNSSGCEKHIFHKQCIEKWILQNDNKATCPICCVPINDLKSQAIKLTSHPMTNIFTCTNAIKELKLHDATLDVTELLNTIQSKIKSLPSQVHDYFIVTSKLNKIIDRLEEKRTGLHARQDTRV